MLWPQWALLGSKDKMLQKPNTFLWQSPIPISSLCPTGTRHLQWWWQIAKEHFCVGKCICRLNWCSDGGSPALRAHWTSFLPPCSTSQEAILLCYTPCRSRSHSSGNIDWSQVMMQPTTCAGRRAGRIAIFPGSWPVFPRFLYTCQQCGCSVEHPTASLLEHTVASDWFALIHLDVLTAGIKVEKH